LHGIVEGYSVVPGGDLPRPVMERLRVVFYVIGDQGIDKRVDQPESLRAGIDRLSLAGRGSRVPEF
jgi:hypothetical protein